MKLTMLKHLPHYRNDSRFVEYVYWGMIKPYLKVKFRKAIDSVKEFINEIIDSTEIII